MLKQQLQLKLAQKLSPQQIQLMKLIQLPTLDFEQRLQNELEENPALETGKEQSHKKTVLIKSTRIILRLSKPKISILMRI